MLMQITLTKEQIKEVFGELRYMGADYCYRYDKDTRKKTEDIEAVKLHLGSMKLGNSVDIRLEIDRNPNYRTIFCSGTGYTGLCSICSERKLSYIGRTSDL